MRNRYRVAAAWAMCLLACSLAVSQDRKAEEVDTQQRQMLQAFQAHYALPDGRSLKRVAPPFIPERATFILASFPPTPNTSTALPTALILRWKKSMIAARPASIYYLPDGTPLSMVLESLTGLMPPEVEAEESLLDSRVSGDFVIRTGASEEEIVEALAAILRDELKLPLRFRFRRVKQSVLVASGEFHFIPLAKYPKSIQVYVDDDDLGGAASAGSGGVAMLLKDVSRRIGKRILSDVNQKDAILQPLKWTIRGGGRDKTEKTMTRRAELLDNLARQTGLKFVEDEREVRVLSIERE